MARDGLAEHSSHDAAMEFLTARYSDTSFSVLDIGVMSGVSYRLVRDSPLRADYTGADISEAVLFDCRARYPEASWLQMSVTDLEFGDAGFDVVYVRQLVECLPYYETAVREAFRVARRHVLLGLSIIPQEPEVLLRRVTPNGHIWLNRYAPGPFENLLGALSDRFEYSEHVVDFRSDCLYLCTKKVD
jgi:ubiquinone/menaquinone biosynthesis C-methylase UbiE